MQHPSRPLCNILQHPQLRSPTPNRGRGLVTPIALQRCGRFLAHIMSSYGVLIGSTSLQAAIEIPSLRGAWNRNEGSLRFVLWNQHQGLLVAHHKLDFAVKRLVVAFDERVTSLFEVL
jgi:hypothetical protein